MKGFKLLFVAGLFALTAACGSNEENANADNGASGSPIASESAPSPSASAPAASPSIESEAVITKETYEKIKNGMTYEEVTEIVGSEGEKVAETGEEGTDMYTFGVLYENKTGTLSNATFIFMNNKLQTKSQYGLE